MDNDRSEPDDREAASSGRELTSSSRVEAFEQELRLERLFSVIAPEMAQAPTLGRFEVVQEVGRGGFGVVYLARDPLLDRQVAVKLCPSLRPEAVEVFEQEARVLAQFSHANIVTVFDAGWQDEDFYFAMEYVDGTDGADFIKTWRRWERVVEVYAAAGAGLGAAHKRAVVHGDFKPPNLLIGDDGRVCVADFGLAQRIDNGAAEGDPAVASYRGGTLAYMAPELFRGQKSDARSDQWAFCVSLWETLCRERPFGGRTAEELLADIALGPPRVWRTKAPRAIFSVLRRGLSVKPEDRYPDMEALVEALRAVLREPEERTPPRPRPRSGRVQAAIVSGLVLLAMGLLGGQLLDRSRGGAFVDYVVCMTAGPRAIARARVGDAKGAVQLLEDARPRASKSQMRILAIASMEVALELQAHGQWQDTPLVWALSTLLARDADDPALERSAHQGAFEAHRHLRAATTPPH